MTHTATRQRTGQSDRLTAAAEIRLTCGSAEPAGSWSYDVAGIHWTSDRAIAALAPFAVRPTGRRRADAPAVPAGAPASGSAPRSEPGAAGWVVAGSASERSASAESRTAVAASGWLGGGKARVVTRPTGRGLEIEIESIGRFRVDTDRGVECLERDVAVAPGRFEEALIGPPMILYLALRGVFCLHASSVATADSAWTFLGLSGSGKSTLAARLGVLGWRRLTDDVTPVSRGRGDGAPSILPRFPQLKLAPEEHAMAAADRRVSWRGACIVHPCEEGAPSLELMAPAEAAWSLLQHTVAGVLFGADLAASHLETLGDAAKSIPVYRLRYPHREQSVERIGTLLGERS